VRVYSSNQLIGRTDERGNLLVPNLLPYYGNRLRIDDRDVPLQYDVQAVEATVAPPFRGGALVAFPVRQVRTVTGTMVVRTGGNEIVPAYGQITLAAGGNTFVSPLGAAGEFYFENISTGAYDATVEYETSVCKTSVQIPASDSDVIKLGKLECTQTAANP
jgi:outer membrane usher protein